jgi:hypothetical protein
LFGIEVSWDLIISWHGRGLSSFALFVSHCLLGVNETAWDRKRSPSFPGLAGRKGVRIAR